MPKTVQGYLDDIPNWEDGNPVQQVGLSPAQWRIWALASAGKFFEGMVVFMVGIALPLITVEFDLTSAEVGIVSASTLFGILVGATALGNLSDKFGRKAMFFAEMVLFCVFLALTVFAPSFPVLVIALVGLGLALGCDYPTAHTMISETIPTVARGRLVLSAFGFQAVGAVAGTIVGMIVLGNRDEVSDWRVMFALVIVPAVVVTVARWSVAQSPHWLFEVGRVSDAERELSKLVERPVKLTKAEKKAIKKEIKQENEKVREQGGIGALFSKPWRRSTILASVPWFLQDLSTYGIGIFTPTIVAATVGTSAASDDSLSSLVATDFKSAEGAAVIDSFLLIGIVLAVILVPKIGSIRLQVWGFVGCAVGLAIAAASGMFEGGLQIVFIFAGFMLFNLLTNIGPNAQTYLLAGEVFPTHLRGTGAGFAASFGKVGAVLTSFLFPILLVAWGQTVILLGLVVASLLGALVTWKFRVETTGKSLAELDAMTDDLQTD